MGVALVVWREDGEQERTELSEQVEQYVQTWVPVAEAERCELLVGLGMGDVVEFGQLPELQEELTRFAAATARAGNTALAERATQVRTEVVAAVAGNVVDAFVS